MTTKETVAKMFELIREQSDNPHFTIGYIEGMMNSLCRMSPKVLEEVISTIDYLESKEKM